MKSHIIFHHLITGKLCLAFLLALICTAAVNADRIILNDGTIEESERVWESERYVHFILKGTQSVEIRYAKEIVARIEGENSQKTVEVQSPAVADSPPLPPSKPEPLHDQGRPPSSSDHSDHPEKELLVDSKIIQKHRGVKFYDPRRPQRYWASVNSRHPSVAAAIEALAEIYYHQPAWIMTHMGEENDLGLIHQNLIRAWEQESKQKTSNILQPGQPPSADDSGAGSDLPSPAEVQTFSETSPADIAKLENNPLPKGTTTLPPPGNQTGSAHSQVPYENARPERMRHDRDIPVIPEGIQFYDPRRPQKYWVDEKHRFSSLKEALKALAGMYGVSEEWIGDHLGNSNNLRQIHQRIREELTSKQQPVFGEP